MSEVVGVVQNEKRPVYEIDCREELGVKKERWVVSNELLPVRKRNEWGKRPIGASSPLGRDRAIEALAATSIDVINWDDCTSSAGAAACRGG